MVYDFLEQFEGPHWSRSPHASHINQWGRWCEAVKVGASCPREPESELRSKCRSCDFWRFLLWLYKPWMREGWTEYLWHDEMFFPNLSDCVVWVRAHSTNIDKVFLSCFDTSQTESTDQTHTSKFLNALAINMSSKSMMTILHCSVIHIRVLCNFNIWSQSSITSCQTRPDNWCVKL